METISFSLAVLITCVLVIILMEIITKVLKTDKDAKVGIQMIFIIVGLFGFSVASISIIYNIIESILK
jgi:hypothetical protein